MAKITPLAPKSDLQLRADLDVPPWQVIVATRRLGLLRRVLQTDNMWMQSLISHTKEAPHTWAAQVHEDLTWLTGLEVGPVPSIAKTLRDITAMSKGAWQGRLKRAVKAELAIQATQADIVRLEEFQQDAFGAFGIPVGQPEPLLDWHCPQCNEPFASLQAMRCHQAAKHDAVHVANCYVEGSVCLACAKDFHTRNRAVRHLKTASLCLTKLRCAFPRPFEAGFVHGPEVATGTELLEREGRPVRVLGPKPMAKPAPRDAPLPPPPAGYLAPEQIKEFQQLADDQEAAARYGTLVGIAAAPSLSQIADITPLLGPLRILLLLYGGRRRPGDVAHFADFFAGSADLQGVHIAVCVVDVVHGAHHDISRGALAFWEGQFRSGRVAAVGAAPPCETWAVSRWADEGWHDRSSPVPLRHFFELWGRRDLTPREQRQIRTANVLLIYTIAFATLCLFHGIGMWIEHPDKFARHERSSAPSIWYLEAIQRLLCITQVVTYHKVQHNQYGGRSIKPTRIFAIRLPTLRKRFSQYRHLLPPRAVLKGKDEQGHWRTAQAKEYPRRLSAALALSMVDAALFYPIRTHMSAHQIDQVLAQLQPYMPPLDQYIDAFEDYGADYVDSLLPIQRFFGSWFPPPSL